MTVLRLGLAIAGLLLAGVTVLLGAIALLVGSLIARLLQRDGAA